MAKKTSEGQEADAWMLACKLVKVIFLVERGSMCRVQDVEADGMGQRIGLVSWHAYLSLYSWNNT
jgi:hypothetical protein